MTAAAAACAVAALAAAESLFFFLPVAGDVSLATAAATGVGEAVVVVFASAEAVGAGSGDDGAGAGVVVVAVVVAVAVVVGCSFALNDVCLDRPFAALISRLRDLPSVCDKLTARDTPPSPPPVAGALDLESAVPAAAADAAPAVGLVTAGGGV